MPGQGFGRLQDLVGRLPGFSGRLGHTADVARRFLGAGRSLLHVARDLVGGGALLFDRRGDRRGDLVDVLDRLRDLLDRGDGIVRRPLDVAHLLGDLVGRLGGLGGQRLDLVRHHREALAGFAGAGRFDGRVQRQQVGLPGDVGDQLHDFADLLRGRGQAFDFVVRLVRLFSGGGGNLVGFRHLAANFLDRSGQFLRRAGDGLYVIRRLAGRHGHGLRLPRCLLGGSRHRFRRRLHRRRRRGHFLDNALDAAFEAVGQGEHAAAATLLRRAPVGLGARVGRLHLGQPVAEHHQSPGHERDFVAAARRDIRAQVAARDLSHAVGQRRKPRHQVAADIKPHDQQGADQAGHPDDCQPQLAGAERRGRAAARGHDLVVRGLDQGIDFDAQTLRHGAAAGQYVRRGLDRVQFVGPQFEHAVESGAGIGEIFGQCLHLFADVVFRQCGQRRGEPLRRRRKPFADRLEHVAVGDVGALLQQARQQVRLRADFQRCPQLGDALLEPLIGRGVFAAG